MKLFQFERGLDRHEVTALIIDGPRLHQYVIKNLSSSGIFSITLHGTTLSYLYDRAAIKSIKTESGQTKRVLIYNAADAVPINNDAIKITRYLEELEITTRLDTEMINFLRVCAVTPHDDPMSYLGIVNKYIDSLPAVISVAQRAEFKTIVGRIATGRRHNTVAKLNDILDTKIVTPDPRHYAGLLPSIITRPKADLDNIKNKEYNANKDWAWFCAIVFAIFAFSLAIYTVYEMGWLDRFIPRDTINDITASIDPCSKAALLEQYPDIVELAVAIEKREVKCYELPIDLQRQLELVDPELVKFVIEQDSLPQSSVPEIPPPEDMTINDVIIPPEELAAQEAARLEAERIAAEEQARIDAEEQAALERQARIDIEAARVAEFERVEMCGDYDYMKSTYATSLNIAIGIQTGELDCSIDELPERYKDSVAAQDQRTIDDYIASGYDLLNP